MRVKPGVDLTGIEVPLIVAALVYDFARRYSGYGQGTITSGRDGAHRDGSLHYVGRAVDLRTVDLPGGAMGAVASGLADWLRSTLPLVWPMGKWDVVQESDHIHVELETLR